MPEFTVENVYGEEIATVKLPKKLPDRVGNEAQKRLGVNVDAKRGEKANIQIGSENFADVTRYLSRTMLNKYTDRDWDFEKNVAADSTEEIAKYYFNRMNILGHKVGEDQGSEDGEADASKK